MDVIAIIKKNSKTKYPYEGKQLNIKGLYSQIKIHRESSKYLLSVDVMAENENPTLAKIVCIRNKANRKGWLVFICTDTNLFEEEIIRIYGNRWSIEFFSKPTNTC